MASLPPLPVFAQMSGHECTTWSPKSSTPSPALGASASTGRSSNATSRSPPTRERTPIRRNRPSISRNQRCLKPAALYSLATREETSPLVLNDTATSANGFGPAPYIMPSTTTSYTEPIHYQASHNTDALSFDRPEMPVPFTCGRDVNRPPYYTADSSTFYDMDALRSLKSPSNPLLPSVSTSNNAPVPSWSTLPSISSSETFPPSPVSTQNNSETIRVLTSRPKPQCFDHDCNGRQFSTFSNLLRHQREQSGTASKHVCEYCGSKFTRTTARKGHMASGKCRGNIKPRNTKP